MDRFNGPLVVVLLRSVLFLFGSAVVALPAIAESGSTENKPALATQANTHLGNNDRNILRGLEIFGSVATGMGSVTGADYTQSPNGGQFVLGGVLSYRLPRWVLDGGLSWLYSHVEGQNSRTLPIDITTRAAWIELSPRYRWRDHWQFGPVFNTALGTDTSFGPNVQSSLASHWLGLKAAYEVSLKSFPVRFTTQVSTDLSIGDRQIYLALVGVQIGLPLSYIPSAVGLDPDKIQIGQASTIRTPTPELRLFLDPQKVFFKTSSAELAPGVKLVLNQIGNYLKAHDTDWEQLEISGHADQRGRFDYNLKLSEKRALSVLTELAKDQKLKDRVKVEAFSFLRLVDKKNNPNAWAKNRRVELVFRNVREPEALVELVRPLMEATQ